jgi:hypothetical protein
MKVFCLNTCLLIFKDNLVLNTMFYSEIHWMAIVRVSPLANTAQHVSENKHDRFNKMTLDQHFCSICWEWWKPLHNPTLVLDWSKMLIDPCDLLLVCSDLIQYPFHVYGSIMWLAISRFWSFTVSVSCLRVTNLGCEKYWCKAKCWVGEELL